MSPKTITKGYDRGAVYSVIRMAAIILGIISLGVIIQIISTDQSVFQEKLDTGGTNFLWIYGVIGTFFIAFFYFLGALSSPHTETSNDKNSDERFRKRLFVFSVIILAFVFFLVCASGGLTQSPFTCLYPAIITITIMTNQKEKTIYYAIGLIVASFSLSTWLAMNDYLPQTKETNLYYWEYTLVVIIVTAGIGIIDNKRSNTKLKNDGSFNSAEIEDVNLNDIKNAE